MTGICVAVTFDGSAVAPEVVDAMVSAAAHRGPDGARTWSGPGAGAGHLRLELTREDRGEVQPLVRGPLVCVADARIDNRADLLRALQRSTAGGVVETDSELLVAAYQTWGRDCAARVVGDFAFAIWDTRLRTLFAARDPVGARTLFYRSEPGRRALVGSEVAQVLAAPGVPDRPDEQSVLADVAGLYALPQASHHEGIRQLAPGHALLIDARDVRSWSYREIGRGPRIRYRSEQDYAEHFREVLDEAVRARLCTDRPAGLLLSGGLDASAIAALGARHVGGGGTPSLTGFSWAFDELRDADERHVSRPLAAELGLPVHDVPADDAWPLSGWPQHAPFRDDPYTWLYQEPFQRSADRARQAGVRVLLTADRGDQVTGGWVYDELGLLRSGRLSSLSADRRAYRERTGRSDRRFLQERLLQPLASGLWPPGRARPLRRRLRALRGGGRRPFAPWVPQAAAERLGLRDVMASALPVPAVRGHARRQRVMAVTDVIGLRVLQLRQRTFAHAGLQHADPWADERVLGFVCAVPQQVVQRQSSSKHLTKQALRGVVPEAARTSPAPSNQYPLYQRAFADREVATVRELMRDSRADAAGLLDAAAVLDTYESLLRGEPLQHDFWYPLTVELWLRRWWG